MSDSPAAALVRIRDLVVCYDDVRAVRDASLAIPAKLLTVLVGPSGCGKTSLMRALAGFERPTSGSIEMAGRTLFSESAFVPAEAREIGMVFQDGALFPHLTLRENVRYGLAGVPDADRIVDRLMAETELDGLAGRYPDELSGGQQQRVALARALAPSPKLVLLDEPFANLDASLRIRMRAQVRTILRARGSTALMVTHDQEEALSIADRVAVMLDGKIVQSGGPAEIYRRPASPAVAEFIGGGQLVRCRIDDGVHTPLGAMRRPESGPVSDAHEAQLLVRPEELALTRAGEGIPATVSHCEFYGHDALAIVRLHSGERIKVRLSGAESPAVGEPVFVRMRRSSFMLYPDGSGQPILVEPTG